HLPILKDGRSGVFGRKPRSIFTPENLVAYHSMFTVLRRLVHAALFPRERRTISMGIVNERMHRLANEFLWSETQHLSSRCIYKSRPSFRSQPADAFIHGRQDQSGAFLNHGQILALQLRLFEKPARFQLAVRMVVFNATMGNSASR